MVLKYNDFMNESQALHQKLEDILNSKFIQSNKWKSWFDWEDEQDGFYSLNTDKVEVPFTYILDETNFIKELNKVLADFNKKNNTDFILIDEIIINKPFK